MHSQRSEARALAGGDAGAACVSRFSYLKRFLENKVGWPGPCENMKRAVGETPWTIIDTGETPVTQTVILGTNVVRRLMDRQRLSSSQYTCDY